ncbi:DNA cytosine methyltransferase [Nocardia cyriacigeorgica]|uniref:DNA cytosine methyltransferase n=1 Tax=Nocardia cyriacigeorgica TaxID=135487 RepID=UPI001893C008|nr:DNA cytosine methyltransferase [Nocardia cyriacigeorgica]MBF6163047.1 DNA cytosine methyltransferase [Nocardia cyriacigeorgica]MBF6202015.1 DNA cytosine methyltransferase [Nocardia cyriacigeorgica]
MSAPTKIRTATHRPAVRRRRFRHDDLIAVDLFSGFGGLTKGIEMAGFTTIMAANHNAYKVDVHEANHPNAEHWIADLVDPEAADYHSAADLPAADLLVAGISCVNHSQANTQKAYEQGWTLFGVEDPEFDERVTRSERDRATANCVLAYVRKHHPRLVLLECTTELTSWGPALPGRSKIGDGSTYRYWLSRFDIEGYDHKVLYLNSQFFGVPQSRDRYYLALWDRRLPAPDLEHRPLTHCTACDDDVEAVWSWKTGIPPSGTVRYGTQYNYRCPRCRREVTPPMTPSLHALDLTNLGTRIGDRKKPLKPATMARIERCRDRFAQFPAILLPAKSIHGSERHPWQPMATQTSQQETALLCTGSVTVAHRHNGDGKHLIEPMDTATSTHEKALLFAAVDNYQGAPRTLAAPLPTTLASETLALMAGVVPFRKNTTPTVGAEPMPTVTSEQIPGLLTTEWVPALADLPVEDCYFRMLGPHEVGRGCGFDTTFPGHQGEFIVWGSARDQCDGFGNAVSPSVGTWIGTRLRAILHATEAIA